MRIGKGNILLLKDWRRPLRFMLLNGGAQTLLIFSRFILYMALPGFWGVLRASLAGQRRGANSLPVITLPVVLLFISLPCSGLFAQPSPEELHEWRHIWFEPDKQMADTTLFRVGNALAQYYLEYKRDSALVISRLMHKRGLKKNNALWIGNALGYLGKYQQEMGQADSALLSFKAALTYLKDDKLQEKTKVLNMIGLIYARQGALDSAVYYLSETIKRGERYGWRNRAAIACQNMGTLYSINGEILLALDYYNKSLKLAEAPIVKHYAYYNIGVILEEVAPEEARANYEQSRKYALQAHTPVDILNSYSAVISLSPNMDSVEQQLKAGLLVADSAQLIFEKLRLLTAANIRFMDGPNPDLEKAKYYTRLSLDIAESIDDPMYHFISHSFIAAIEAAENRHAASLKICREVRPYFESHHDSTELIGLYRLFSSNFKSLGQLDSSLYYLEKYLNIANAYENKDFTRKLISRYLEYKKELEVKALAYEKELAEQRVLEAHLKNRQNLLAIALLALLLTSVSLIYYVVFRQRQKRAYILEKMNKTLESEKEKLRFTNAKLQRFSSIVSHDILSNLNLVLSSGNLLVGSQPRKESLVHYYDLTHKASHQLKAYCIRLLEEARKENAPKEEHTDPMPSVHTVLARMGPALRQAKLQIELGELSPTTLPESVVEQIFQNLISNALQYGATAEKPMLRIGEEQDGQGRIRWVVEDNGPGIPAELREVIFQGGHGASTEVRGIGLSLLRATLREYGADIRAEERPGGGARFVVTPEG